MNRDAFVAQLRSADCSWNKTTLVALLHAAASEIEHMCGVVVSLQADLEGAIDNQFFDKRDAYFEGVNDGKR